MSALKGGDATIMLTGEITQTLLSSLSWLAIRVIFPSVKSWSSVIGRARRCWMKEDAGEIDVRCS